MGVERRCLGADRAIDAVLGRVKSRPFRDHRLLVEGVIYRFRPGIAWRDLPTSFGPWQAVWKRHKRFSTDAPGTKLVAVGGGAAPLLVVVEGSLDADRSARRRAYSSRAIRTQLRSRHIEAVIPQPSGQIANRRRRGSAGGRPPAFDAKAHKGRNTRHHILAGD